MYATNALSLCLSGAIWPLTDSLRPSLHILLNPCYQEHCLSKAAFLSPVAHYYYFLKESKWSSRRNHGGTGGEDDGFPHAAWVVCIFLARNELEHRTSDCLGWGQGEAHFLLQFWMLQLLSSRQLCYKKESRWTSCSPGTGPLPCLS